MIVKNLNKYFTFEVTILDDKNIRRRFRASNFQSTTRVKPFICTMPMKLDEGWNQIQFNLADFCRRAYGTNYVETVKVQVHANCRLRRVFFCDRLYKEEELPAEFKLYLPIKKEKGQQVAASTTAQKKVKAASNKNDTQDQSSPAPAVALADQPKPSSRPQLNDIATQANNTASEAVTQKLSKMSLNKLNENNGGSEAAPAVVQAEAPAVTAA